MRSACGIRGSWKCYTGDIAQAPRVRIATPGRNDPGHPATKRPYTGGQAASATLLGGARFRGTRSGVTLVEILVVVAILGILIATIGLVGMGVREHGKRNLTYKSMDVITSAIEAFKADKGSWPPPPNNPSVDPDPNNDLYGRLPDPYPEAEFYRVEPVQPASPPYVMFIQNYTGDSTPFQEAGADDIPSIQGLFAFLSLSQDAEKILGRLPENAIRNVYAEAGRPRRVTPSSGAITQIDLKSMVDAWKNPMRYRLYDYRNNGRPFLWSAGPDGKFAPNPNDLGNDPNGYGKDDLFSDKAE
jgi:prepilin-type N-terminal cleavage/methylation domain-containing protein